MASVVWTLALTYLVFQTLLGIPVCWIVPIVLFVVLLGLGMDYDIFITTRVRENKVRGMSNDDAIDAAICSASGTISLCALIMGGTFLTLLVGSSSMLQEFGFALGVGILIDGLFMVTFVGPAVMHLMGEYSWKGPAFLQKKQRNE
jgi:RND superfamily putative drug exporter